MIRYFIFLFFLISNTAVAVTCVSSCSLSSTSTLAKTISASDNYVGKTYNSSVVYFPARARLRWNQGDAMVWARWADGNIPSPFTAPVSETFRSIDDYIAISFAVQDGCGTKYVPYNVTALSQGDCNRRIYYQGEETTTTDREFHIRVKLRKKIVSGTYSKNIPVMVLGVCQPRGCSSAQAVISRVFLSLNITATQTCTLNAGQVINIDFGNISSGAFTTTGARPEGVNDIVRNVNVSCDNIAPNTAMTVRLQADKVSGKAVVTNTNNDVGFVVADGNGTALTPNNLSSVIPFTLDSYGNSNVTIRVYPVSVTGNKPAEGPVTSQAYLRVDFA